MACGKGGADYKESPPPRNRAARGRDGDAIPAPCLDKVMFHWLSEHRVAFGDITLAWFVPILLIYVTTRIFRQDF